MRWYSPPDRREIILIVFSLTVFFLAFNLEISTQLVGLDIETSETVFGHLGFQRSGVLASDGRKLPAWRDTLEDLIFGNWTGPDDQPQSKSSPSDLVYGKHGTMWLKNRALNSSLESRIQGDTIDEGFSHWGTSIPETKLRKHVAGYTILTNLFLFNRTAYIVTDNINAFPPLSSILTVTNFHDTKWEFISASQARDKFGPSGAFIKGATWLVSDFEPYNTTLLSLWRAYSSLDPSIGSDGRTILASPRRLVFPNMKVYSDPNPPLLDWWVPRRRTDTGSHPYLPKALFPDMIVTYFEDWEDFERQESPFVFQEVLISDQIAASQVVNGDHPPFAAAFQHEASIYWWEPVRRSLLEHFGTSEEKTDMVTITYLQRQSQDRGHRLEPEDHDQLVLALQKLRTTHHCEVNIVSALDDETDWTTRMSAIVQSDIVLGIANEDLLDAAFMKRSPQATLMEIFAPDSFSYHRQLISEAIGIKYVAWRNNVKFTNHFPPVASKTDQEVHIDVDALVTVIRDILQTR